MVTHPLTGMPTNETKDESIVAHFCDGTLMIFVRGETIINGLDEPGGYASLKRASLRHTLYPKRVMGIFC